MSFVQVPPDSTGKKVYTKQATVGTDVVQTQVVHLADESSPENLASIDNKGALSVRFAEGQPQLGGFGGLKVNNERVLGVYESSLDTYETLFSNTTVNGGTLLYDTVASSEVLTATSISGSSAKITTNRYHYYLPGSANVFKMTIACGDTGKVGNSRSWGGYDDSDGVFFRLKDTALQTVIRSSVTGAITELEVPQSLWNKDKLDGTGTSGVTIDITKINVYWIDYQWLGAGRVRFGIFGPEGERIVAHEFRNAGAFALPYMRTGTLPLRVENTNTGVTGSSSEIRAVCLAAYTEGTHEDYTYWRFSDIEATALVSVNTPIISLATLSTVNSKHNSVVVYPETLNIYTDQAISLTMWQDTEVTGGTWNNLASTVTSNISSAVNTTNSQKFKTLFFDAGAHSVCIDQYFEKNDEGIQTRADGVPEVWSFIANKLSASDANVRINVGYKELW